MKRHTFLLCFLLLGLFGQVSTVLGVSGTYTWQVEAGYSKYEIFIVTQDHWKTDTTVNVVVRLTLVDKHWSLDHTKTNWMQIVIKSSKFILDSGRQEEQVTLTNEGDYWEKTIPMQVPSANLEAGENVTMSIEFQINIDEMDVSQHKWWNHATSSSDNPIYANVYRPSFWETPTGILVIGLGVIVVGAILATVGALLYRKSRKVIPRETPS